MAAGPEMLDQLSSRRLSLYRGMHVLGGHPSQASTLMTHCTSFQTEPGPPVGFLGDTCPAFPLPDKSASRNVALGANREDSHIPRIPFHRSWEANCNLWTLGRISVGEMSACTGRISSVTIRLFERLPLRLHGFLPGFPLFLGCLLVQLPGLARIFCSTGTLSFGRYRPGNTQGD